MISAETDGTGFCLRVAGVLIREAGEVSPPAPPPKARILDRTVMGMDGEVVKQKEKKIHAIYEEFAFLYSKVKRQN